MPARPLARRMLALGAWLLACRPTAAPDPPDDPGPVDPPAVSPQAEEPLEPEPCGEPGASFEAHAWIPATVPAAASIALDDPDLGAALARLAALTRSDAHGLPIPLAFSLSQWSWQVPTLVATLRQAGFQPAELVFVAGDEADHAWVWASACDLDEAERRIEAAWHLRSRRVVEGVIASPEPAEDPQAPAFPYDLLMLPGERFALVPAGRAAAVLRRWDRPAPSMGLGPAAPGAGPRIDALEPAPVRLVVQGRALLDPSAETAPESARSFRITADALQLAPDPGADASLGDRP
ncbi:MAG: hypothetical protein H6712_19610 [Myxococcales bacterium]|nr:hypothetical protein [Myxococcales bacterium]MCB9716084.1 hypothetical protein [Myxococcales bacterium]